MSETLLLRGGVVHDGLGSPGSRLDVLIVDGMIARIEAQLESDSGPIVDCEGLLVSPGFVDLHAHSDLVPMMRSGHHGYKLLQGVTTEVNGNCGISPAPLTKAAVPLYEELFGDLGGGVEIRAGSFADHLARVEAAGTDTNVAALVGHSALRLSVSGMEMSMSDQALVSMRGLADDAFRAGAIGLSTGLIYAPGCYGDTDEVVALAQVARVHGAAYATHMRDEGEGLQTSLAEAISVGRRAGVRVQVSHCKAMGERAHGRGHELVSTLEHARAEGIDVLGDQYPYAAGATVLVALLPPSALAGGGEEVRRRLGSTAERARLRALAERGGPGAGQWRQSRPDGVLITGHADIEMVGRRLDAISRDAACDPWDALCDLITVDTSATVVVELMREDDVEAIMRSPLVGVGSDNGPPVGMQHPRTWGCFPRFFGTYVRERGVVPWEEAIRKATSLAAAHLGIRGRGVLVPGAAADVAVIDPAAIGHAGTYDFPDVRPTGVVHVLVNGKHVVRDGTLTGESAGRVLRAQ